MKTAVYIEDGIAQIVLTPEDDLEKAILKFTQPETHQVTFLKGEFYQTRGGWTAYGLGGSTTTESLIVKIHPNSVPVPGNPVVQNEGWPPDEEGRRYRSGNQPP